MIHEIHVIRDGWCDLWFAGLDGDNSLFRNLGGWTFENIASAAGLGGEGFAATGIALADIDGDGDLDALMNSVGNGTEIRLNDGRGQFTLKETIHRGHGGMCLALADIDNDGDLDVAINNLNAGAWLLRNETDAPRINVRLAGRGKNTQAIGAKIRLLGGNVVQSQEMICAGRYLSAADAMRVFAASATNQFTIEVTWCNGTKSRADW